MIASLEERRVACGDVGGALLFPLQDHSSSETLFRRALLKARSAAPPDP